MRKPLVALLATTAIVVAACGGGTTQSPSSGATATPGAPTPEPTPTKEIVRLDDSDYASRVQPGKDGGTLIVGDWQEANEFNPFYVGQVTEANVQSAVFSTLVTFSDDFRYWPDLATSVPTIDNGGVKVPGDGGDAMTVTWTLRPDLKWSDGEPLTCDDFKYAVEWVTDPDNVGVIIDPFDISTVECTDDVTLVHHFTQIYEGYLTAFTSPLPRHYLGDIPMADQVAHEGFRADQVKDLPTSGAFKFDSVSPGAELRLVRNDNYTGPLGNKAHLDTLVFKWYGEVAAEIAGYRAGEIDFATDLAESDVPGVTDLDSAGQLSNISALLYEFLRPNWADGSNEDSASGVGGCSRNPAVQDRGDGCPMADSAMREAIAWAIDKDQINEAVLAGQATVANGSITPAAWFYSDQEPTSYDPEKAKSILDAGGWTVGADGFREKDGLKAKIELCTTTAQRRVDTLALLASWLNDVGIEAVPNPVSAADIFADFNEATIDTPCALSHSNFDLAEHAFSSSIDPLGGYFSYHSSQFEPNGANDAQVNNPDLDAAYETVLGSVDFAKIKDAMATVQKVFHDLTVEIPLYYRGNIELHSPRVGNFFANGTQAGMTWNAVDWYVNE